MKFNYVYVTTNLLNNKKYIGSHCTDNIDDGYLGSGRALLKAIKKYGKTKFKREILESFDNSLSARKKEGFYINKIETLTPKGYNLSPLGGIGFKDSIHSEETKRKQSIAAKNKPPEKCSMYGKKHSEETKKKMSKAAKKRNPNMLGKKHSDETKEKMRKKALGRKVSEEVREKISKTLKNKKPKQL